MRRGSSRGAVGQAGRNEEYVLNTVEHLQALGIRDHWLEEVGRLVSRRRARLHPAEPFDVSRQAT